jgi:hypothetical protein
MDPLQNFEGFGLRRTVARKHERPGSCNDSTSSGNFEKLSPGDTACLFFAYFFSFLCHWFPSLLVQ